MQHSCTEHWLQCNFYHTSEQLCYMTVHEVNHSYQISRIPVMTIFCVVPTTGSLGDRGWSLLVGDLNQHLTLTVRALVTNLWTTGKYKVTDDLTGLSHNWYMYFTIKSLVTTVSMKRQQKCLNAIGVDFCCKLK